MKYLSIPDFHFSMSHLEDSKECGQAVATAAKDNHVDFILVPGDWFDAPIMATDKGGLREAKKIIKSWLDVCPVAAIEGTPTHDAPGCYGIFEDLGLAVVSPDKVYGYYDDFGDGFRKIDIVKEFNNPDCLIFGIPELSKKNIYAKLGLSGEQANAAAIDLLEDHIVNFVAPNRVWYSDIPAIGMLHGVVTDSTAKEFETDQIKKRADIVISTDILAKANLDYWNIGHIHTQWSSQKINASYGGGPMWKWGERGFLPGFELIIIEDKECVKIERSNEQIIFEKDGRTRIEYDEITVPYIEKNYIDIQYVLYGTPRREKITLPFRKWEDSVAYWVETDDPDFKLPDNVHPWSRVTAPQVKKETQRITEEQARNIKSLWDLFVLCDPDIDVKLKSKVDLITEKVKREAREALDVCMTYLKVEGCDFFDSRTVELDIAAQEQGLTRIAGEEGEGKSALLSFCSMYPIVIGKKTKSGRDSAIKDFFSGNPSQIMKRGTVNGVEHEHIINIVGAHTQNPKIECSLSINGIPQLDKGTFDEMFQTCEKLYGPFEDYRITSFYEQPQQSTDNKSGLMTVGKTEARNIVQNIADIDRSQEKQFALDQALKLEKDIKRLEIEIDVMERDAVDPKAIIEELERLTVTLKTKLAELETVTNDANVIKKRVDLLTLDKRNNDEQQIIKTQKQENLDKIEAKIHEIHGQIGELKRVNADLESNKDAVAQMQKLENERAELNTKIQGIMDKNKDIESAHYKELIEYNNLISQYNKIKSECELNIEMTNSQIEMLRRENAQINKPCEYCGKISFNAAKTIELNNETISEYISAVNESQKHIASLILPIKPQGPEFDSAAELQNSLNYIDNEIAQWGHDALNVYQGKVSRGEIANVKIDELTKSLTENTTAHRKLIAEIHDIVLRPEIDNELRKLENELQQKRAEYSDIRDAKTKAEAEIKGLEEKAGEIEKRERQIKIDRAKLKTMNADYSGWSYIAKMLNPDKIPALELELVIGEIDEEATKIITPFHEGRYSFETETQTMGKKGAVDKFDILIHDADTGKTQSLFQRNPGHKAFFSDSYIKSLIKTRQKKNRVSYGPIVIDEADGPISPKRIQAYYEIQQDYFMDKKVFIVSHSTDVHNFIQNVIEMEEIKK